VTCFVIGTVVFGRALGLARGVDLALYGALLATLAELIPFLDDNLTIPLVSGLAMQFNAWRLGLVL
jgi:dolichol kinase